MHRLLPVLLTTIALNAAPSWSQTGPQPLSTGSIAAADPTGSRSVAGWPLLVHLRGGVGLVDFGGGGENTGPAVGLGASVVHPGTGVMLTGRALAADLRSFTERAVVLGYGRSFGPFFLSAGAGVGYAKARYGPATWTTGEPQPVIREYASMGLPVEAQATWRWRFLGVYLSHARSFNEEVPFSSTMLGLQLQLGSRR
jgi:hypothetical protein